MHSQEAGIPIPAFSLLAKQLGLVHYRLELACGSLIRS